MRSCGLTMFLLLSLALVACRGGREGREWAYFPPEAVDHLAMTTTMDVEIFAIGKDTIVLEGTVAVHRSGPLGPDGKTMKGDMIGASLRGKSEVFGEVVAVQSPLRHSPCEYTWEKEGVYRGHFDINGWFWMPEHDLLVYSAEPVHVSGTASSIPPVGSEAETGDEEIALHDLQKPEGNAIGVLRHARGQIHDLVKIEDHLDTGGAAVSAELR